MLPLSDRQREFGAAILNPQAVLPLGLVGPDGEPSLRRFSVYRNNVVVGLIDALKQSFPAVTRIVGEEFMRAMARIYVAHEPPSSPILLYYGEGFADFIEGFEPAVTVPYLADVARMERAWHESYHARESVALDPASLAGVAPEDFERIVFTLRPSLRLVPSNYPSLSIWQMNLDDGEPRPIDLLRCENAIFLRPQVDVEARAVSDGSFAFLQALVRGETVVQALREATQHDEPFDLGTHLSELFRMGAFESWKLAEVTKHV
ncbi:MAG: DNA-binding domain-containing protein [Aestuariivirga sp.]